MNQTGKNDAGKPRMDLLSGMLYPLMSAVSRVREFGIQKYTDPENWKTVENAHDRYKAALLRHITAWADDENSTDQESGLSHLWHAACNIAFLIALEFWEVD